MRRATRSELVVVARSAGARRRLQHVRRDVREQEGRLQERRQAADARGPARPHAARARRPLRDAGREPERHGDVLAVQRRAPGRAAARRRARCCRRRRQHARRARRQPALPGRRPSRRRSCGRWCASSGRRTASCSRSRCPTPGVMETDWAENRAKLPQDAIRNALGKLLDQVYSTGERDKFRTRLERSRGRQGHRDLHQPPRHGRAAHRARAAQYDSSMWQPRPPDPELEAEFLQPADGQARLPRSSARAPSSPRAGQPRGAGEDRDRGGRRGDARRERAVRSRLAPRRPRARPRRLHGRGPRPLEGHLLRALRRSDEGRRHEVGRRLPLEARVLARADEPAKAEQYRVAVQAGRATRAEVQVLNKDGAPDPSGTSKRILSLLYDQLK